MNFLEANRVLSSFSGGVARRFLFATSGTANPFDIYLRAAAAKLGMAAEVRTLPFNTLAQALLGEPRLGEEEIFLLLPWDFVAETDWRSGLPARRVEKHELCERATSTAQSLIRRQGARVLYLGAPVPPLFPDLAEVTDLTNYLNNLAVSLGARIVSPKAFSLGSYLSTGCPVSGAFLGEIAEAAIQLVFPSPGEDCKVLVTDLDNSLWGGVVAEDGLAGISFAPEGRGYKHFLYQSYLAKLKREGTLLAAVSRNDSQVALEPLRSRGMVLGEKDFVCVLCSYHAKSAQISEISKRLNLGLESFAFVDDNPVELAEVSSQLPQVRCLAFPSHDDDLPQLFQDLCRLFARSVVTAEDRERTAMYRRRLEGIVPAELDGADLSSFLRGLQMTLTLHDRSRGGYDRAIQLINKTNQFNLNGRRVTAEGIAEALSAGARLFGASLSDRNGAHGEIIACLVSRDGIIRHFVMSCRVFQRRVEYAFLSWLALQAQRPHGLDFLATPRNEPFRNFLKDPVFQLNGGEILQFDAAQFASAHAADLALFTLQGPAND